jgi:hypothetical protein
MLTLHCPKKNKRKSSIMKRKGSVFFDMMNVYDTKRNRYRK